MKRRRAHRPFARSLFRLLLGLAAFMTSSAARAERELIVPFHEAGHLVLDELAGMRAQAGSGARIAGIVGASSHTHRADALGPGGAATETSITHLWLAPSADVFVTDHVSVGGTLALEHSWGTLESGGHRLELPSMTAMTIVPRVGFFAAFGDRFGLWSRAGFGWTSLESASLDASSSAIARQRMQALLLELDVAVIYRFTETFYMRTGPELQSTLGGGSASMHLISGVVGFGMNLEL